MRWLLLLMSNMGHSFLIHFFDLLNLASVLNFWSVNPDPVVETSVKFLLV